MLDGFAARLDALQSRLGVLETPGENPFAEISEQLTRLYAQKDAAVETVFARLAPLEARLAELQALAPQVAALASSAAAADPRAALDDFAVRLETLHWTQGEVAAGLAALRAVIGDGSVAQPFAVIAEQLTPLHAQKDAALAAVEARLAEMDARIDARVEDPGDAEEAARSEARAIAEELAQLRATAAQTELFADRLAVLEASLPRLNAAQSQMMRVLERQAGGSAALPAALTGPLAAAPTRGETAPAPEPADPFAAFRDLPRVVSLHHK
jgi:DNA anti-recombination protein RmuC